MGRDIFKREKVDMIKQILHLNNRKKDSSFKNKTEGFPLQYQKACIQIWTNTLSISEPLSLQTLSQANDIINRLL